MMAMRVENMSLDQPRPVFVAQASKDSRIAQLKKDLEKLQGDDPAEKSVFHVKGRLIDIRA
jgi:hypothetical protein